MTKLLKKWSFLLLFLAIFKDFSELRYAFELGLISAKYQN